jgi:translation initiation factor IF-2
LAPEGSEEENMNDTTENDGKKPGGTLTLKRPAAVEQSRVKQSFSHGRTKTVVVETKRKTFCARKTIGHVG